MVIAMVAPHVTASQTFLHLMFSFGVAGVFPVSLVDSSFVPLPVPGITDIMLVLLAARHANPWVLIALATAGSAIGGLVSHQAGHAGGLALIEQHTPKRMFQQVTRWMESHAILAVALPAILPPPMPLTPFVLAAGALKMSRRKFMVTFTLSRFARHALAVWLGVHYGRHVLVLWRAFSTTWGSWILAGIWVVVAASVGYALWRLWKLYRQPAALTAGLLRSLEVEVGDDSAAG